MCSFQTSPYCSRVESIWLPPALSSQDPTEVSSAANKVLVIVRVFISLDIQIISLSSNAATPLLTNAQQH